MHLFDPIAQIIYATLAGIAVIIGALRKPPPRE
jgi:hypothetical protein